MKRFIIRILLYLYKIFKIFTNKYRQIVTSLYKRYLFGETINLSFSDTVVVKYPENVEIGNNVRIGPNSILGAYGGIFLEDNVVLSQGVVLETAYLDIKSNVNPLPHKCKPITIKKGAWLATNVIVLSGVTIGENAIVSAGAVVRKDIPSDTIYMADNTQKKIIKNRA